MKGLSSLDAENLLKKHGKNELVPEKKESFFMKILEVLKEPMFLLLIIAATIYFILGEPRDGAIMLIFVAFVISIDVFQEWKTDKTLKALKDLSSPHCTVLRDGEFKEIDSKLLVPTDIMKISEGEKIAADGIIISLNDLCVDESSLTGESETVWKALSDNKGEYWKKNCCYAGTIVTHGSALVDVTQTGANTEYGKIGTNIASAQDTSTPLQQQTSKLVKYSAILGCFLFLLVGIITYFNVSDHAFADRIIESILSGITLAMAIIPEEFPVILAVFLSMGAWRLAKKNSLIRRLPSVETLGSVSVLCVDKTGTLTKNQMEVRKTVTFCCCQETLLNTAGMACEVNPYDPMEKAIIKHCNENSITNEMLFSKNLCHEYPFTNETKRMGHIWDAENDNVTVTVKGSPETVFPLCNLNELQLAEVTSRQNELSQEGLRVIAVAYAEIKKGEIPNDMSDLSLSLVGLIGLADPPREAVPEAIKVCKKAGIRVVMITGDNGITAASIASQIGLDIGESVITGEMINAMSDEELKEKIKNTSVFARVVPEHKMRIVKCFKELGHIVAMTGDGVNDAPALKYADIGIAMGKRGTEVAREAADMVLMDDNFATIVETIKDGRRIYDNIRKAISYVFVIHTPIALAALFAPLLKIPPSNIMLLPLHVVLLELIIDPTCSIVFERQPAENDIMSRKPRNPKNPLVTFGVIAKSLIQGFVMFAASFGTYYMTLGTNPELARSMGIAIIIISNLFLVYVNSSDRSFAITLFFKNIKDKVLWIINCSIIAMLAIVLYTPISSIVKLAPLSLNNILICIGISAVAVLWYDIIKIFRGSKN